MCQYEFLVFFMAIIFIVDTSISTLNIFFCIFLVIGFVMIILIGFEKQFQLISIDSLKILNPLGVMCHSVS